MHGVFCALTQQRQHVKEHLQFLCTSPYSSRACVSVFLCVCVCVCMCVLCVCVCCVCMVCVVLKDVCKH